jgi:hypothetical protein
MQKRFLSFLLAASVSLTALSLAACDGSEERGKYSLDGKTIVFDSVEDIIWDDGLVLHAFATEGDVEYMAEMTAQQFVEEFWDTRVISEVTDETSLDTLEQAMTAFSNKAISLAHTRFYNYKISEDGTTVTQYEMSDVNFENPVATHTGRKTNTEYGYMYCFGEEDGIMDLMIVSEPGFIRCFTTMEAIYFDMTPFEDIMVTLTATNGSGKTCQRSLAFCCERIAVAYGKNYYKIA